MEKQEFFEHQTAGAILNAIKRFNKIKFNYRLIKHAANYSEKKKNLLLMLKNMLNQNFKI